MRGDHPAAGIDRDGQAVGVPVDEPSDELIVGDRRGADDDPRHARFGERLGGVEVADAAAGLQLDREPVRDGPDVRQIRRCAGAGAVEVDNLVKRYRNGKTNAVDGISFTVRKGEFPILDLVVMAGMFVVFLVVGTALFVRNERNR